MSPEVSKRTNIAMIFSDIEDKKSLYHEIYKESLKLFKTHSDVSARTLREQLSIPYDLSLQIIQQIKIEHIQNKEDDYHDTANT